MFGFYSKKWQKGVAISEIGAIIKPVTDRQRYNEIIFKRMTVIYGSIYGGCPHAPDEKLSFSTSVRG